MRAARLPSSMAVCAASPVCNHYVVTAVNSCASYTRHMEESAKNPQPSSCFRADAFLSSEWTTLLHFCRALTHPQKEFNICSPGDTGSCSSAATNRGFVHIVERTKDDFRPNNLIYHELHKYQVHDEPPSTAAAASDFSSFVREQQTQSPQCVQSDLQGELYASLNAEEKRKLDPLAGRAEAVAATAQNASLVDVSAPSSNSTFNFFPFPVPVAAGIPYLSQHFCVLVNLKPIVPHHLMVVPRRCVSTIHALTEEECDDWGRTVTLTIQVLKALTASSSSSSSSSTGFSIAIQQGAMAGQTVPHLHTHIIPFDPRGKLAGEPESEEQEQLSRPPRTPADMKADTDMLKPIFAAEARKLHA